MTSLKDELKGFSLIDKSVFLSETLICLTEYLLDEKREIVQFQDESFVTFFDYEAVYFKIREDGLFEKESIDIEDFMSMIYDMSRAELVRLAEEIAQLEKIDGIDSKIEIIITDLWKSTLKSSLSKFEIAYERRDI